MSPNFDSDDMKSSERRDISIVASSAFHRCLVCLHHYNNQPYLARVTLNSKADKPVAPNSEWNWNLECWILLRESKKTGEHGQ